MAKTKVSHRLFAFILAGVFLFSALATGVAVLLTVISQDKSNNSSSSSTTNSSTASDSKDLTHLNGTELQGFTPTSNVPALQITDTKVGTGATATANSTVEVLYTGAVASTGKIFQASTDSSIQPVSISLSEVIEGWQKGIPGMKVGGTRQLLIPADEAYGANPPSGSGIPANAPLVFNITLLGVKQ